MSMNRIELRGQKLLIEQWDRLKEKLGELGPHVVRPDDGYQIFRLMEDDPRVPAGQIAYTVGPVVFQVSERADDPLDMYIAVQGWIHVDHDTLRDESRLKTTNFGTEVGYFRYKRDRLSHVYGAHYDLSYDEVGHPIFHGQMRSFNERGALISANYAGVGEESDDHMARVLKTVRLPTAQMDFFGVVLQIGADHLMSKDSGDDQKKVFGEMREISKLIQGAGHLWPRLNDAGSCMRAQHWYS
jgi:hypothetical protein